MTVIPFSECLFRHAFPVIYNHHINIVSLDQIINNTICNESAFIGVARLATLLNSDGKPTQRVGKYQNNDEENETWKPIFDTDTNSFRDCFTRTERGTDVIIVGFTQSINWVKNVTKAVLKNFFVAISEGTVGCFPR